MRSLNFSPLVIGLNLPTASCSVKAKFKVYAQLKFMCIVLIPMLQGASQKRPEDEESDLSPSQSDLSRDEDGSELGTESDDLMTIDAKALAKVFADEQPEILGPESNHDVEEEDEGASVALINRRSLSRSSCHSVPPLTDSDLVLSEDDIQDEEEGMELVIHKTGDTTLKKTKARKVGNYCPSCHICFI